MQVFIKVKTTNQVLYLRTLYAKEIVNGNKTKLNPLVYRSLATHSIFLLRKLFLHFNQLLLLHLHWKIIVIHRMIAITLQHLRLRLANLTLYLLRLNEIFLLIEMKHRLKICFYPQYP
jgi:hypothetical protein